MARVIPRLIALDIETVDRSNEVSVAKITSGAADSDFMSFAEARSGGSREYVLAMTIAQDHASATLWDLIWTGVGTEVDGVYAPYGNDLPSVSQPHYGFVAVVAEPDGDFLGAEATDSTTAVATIEVEWKLTGKPIKITA
ncbi:hypothetical protein G5C66_07840 [Nocardioides sp. KC13]|uniref:Uncharacterized protein n=1 Tax=Nocardioides turkmenicus TaxID=2711220 RepID=A0A6M1R8G3_9ACTN|nr:hypothetical protein [Nocardioides sp. KC13]NGN92647.1 hypothetical protein [Nocardioides sp. KC13]